MGFEEFRPLRAPVQTDRPLRAAENPQNYRRRAGLVGWGSRTHGTATTSTIKMSNATQLDVQVPSQSRGAAMSETVFRWSGTALVGTVWTSATLFGLYILAFYAGALAEGQVSQCNQSLPGLYDPHAPAATSGLGLHFFAGGVILILGCIQLIG